MLALAPEHCGGKQLLTRAPGLLGSYMPPTTPPPSAPLADPVGLCRGLLGMVLAGTGTRVYSKEAGIHVDTSPGACLAFTKGTVRFPVEAETRFLEADSAKQLWLRLPSVPSSDHRGSD